ncbi:GspH/FimT family protein [Pseudoalteromonas sp.]|uniref:GspH/FimT family protein n=1 Tax=Pseudoalteromonas sp. TaxID=53249 RepID=UPI001BCB05D3|nr:GspH/FimT family protein [Pseudoalteromonas sp.]
MKTKKNGFTVLELMVTVAIVAIIASIAMWNSGTMLKDNRAEGFLLELKRNISFARSQAASTDEIVIICPAPYNSVKNSPETLTCGTEWAGDNVIITFIDANNNGQYDSANDSLIRIMEKANTTDKVTFSGSNQIRFNTSGRITTTPGNFVFFPNDDKDTSKALTLSQSGTAFYIGSTDKSD